MLRSLLSLMLLPVALGVYGARDRRPVVVDCESRLPLGYASVFDCNGNPVGVCGANGSMPYVSADAYPLTVRYMGYGEKTVESPRNDTIALCVNVMSLPEMTVDTRKPRMLHMLAYVREYSTLSTYTDTVFMFREKMVDFMLPTSPKMKYRGWNTPRVMSAKSYYRFTNANGLDSVSDHCGHHFSWSDWIGVVPSVGVPERLACGREANDTVTGRYGIAEIWQQTDGQLSVNVDVLADTTARKYVPGLRMFFKDDIEFERFKVRITYDVAQARTVGAADLTGYAFNIESNGRGHSFLMFNRKDEPLFVSTYAEVYFLDKEYIPVKEARKWEKHEFWREAVDIIKPDDAPAIQPSVAELMARVNSISHEGIRLGKTPDRRLVGRIVSPQNFGQRALQLLKQLTGISNLRSNRNNNRQWREFRERQKRENKR